MSRDKVLNCKSNIVEWFKTVGAVMAQAAIVIAAAGGASLLTHLLGAGDTTVLVVLLVTLFVGGFLEVYALIVIDRLERRNKQLRAKVDEQQKQLENPPVYDESFQAFIQSVHDKQTAHQ